MRGVDESTLDGDFLEGGFRFGQQLRGALEALAAEKGARRDAMMAAKEAGEMGGTQGMVAGDLDKAEGLAEVVAKIVGGRFDGVTLAWVEAGVRRAWRATAEILGTTLDE